MKMPDFKKFDKYIHWKDEKKEIISKYNEEYATDYSYFSEMVYDLFMNKNKTTGDIGKLFGITHDGIRYHLKKMKCPMHQHGGARTGYGKVGVPGVYPYSNKFYVFYTDNGRVIYIGTYKNVFMAVWFRRCAEIKYGHRCVSDAQKYINENWRKFANGDY